MDHRVIHVVKMMQAHSGDKLSGQIVWFDHDAEALFDAALNEIVRRVTERGEPLEIDGLEGTNGVSPGNGIWC